MTLRVLPATMAVSSLMMLGAAPGGGVVGPARGVNRCSECHRAATSEHLRDWDLSVHARSGVSCSSCHSGDESQSSADQAHVGLQMTSARRAGGTREVLDGCGRCHVAVEAVFRRSAHFRSNAANREVPTCIDCHTAAGGNVLAADRVPGRCGTCHQPAVGQRATELLDLLRRLVLARTLVEERLLALERKGTRVDEERAAFEDIDPMLTDVAAAWHRFDLGPVEQRTRAALRHLDAIHDALEKKGP